MNARRRSVLDEARAASSPFEKDPLADLLKTCRTHRAPAPRFSAPEAEVRTFFANVGGNGQATLGERPGAPAPVPS